MHDAKQADYGSDYDPFANIRDSEKLGIPGWCGAILRNNDKQVRLQKAVRDTLDKGKPNLKNEGVKDSLLDQAVYAIIAYVMYEDWEDQNTNTAEGLEAIDLDEVADVLSEGGLFLVAYYDPESDTTFETASTTFAPPTEPAYTEPVGEFDVTD